MKYLRNIGKALLRWIMQTDRVLNALAGGDPDESLSSRFGRQKDEFWFYYRLCLFLSLFDRNHCEEAIHQGEGDDQITPYDM